MIWKKRCKNTLQATPLFLIGAPRSGTTFFARILNAHPEIIQTYETAAFMLLNGIITQSQNGSKEGLFYGKEYQKIWCEHLLENAKKLIEDFYLKLANVEKRKALKYWGDKHPHHSDALPFLEETWPNARYIYIVRDPRCSAASISKMNDWDFQRSLNVVEEFAKKYEAFSESKPQKTLMTISYETLTKDPHGSIDKVLSWLELNESDVQKSFLEKHLHINAHTHKSFMPITTYKKEDETESPMISKWLEAYMKKYQYLSN